MDPTHWKYVVDSEVINAALFVVIKEERLACLDSKVREAVLLVCRTLLEDEAEPVR